MIDLHVHTARCRHAVGCARDYVEAAAERGVKTMAFTEHLPFTERILAELPNAAAYAMPAEEFPHYIEEVAEAAARGRDLGVEVLLGAEIDHFGEGERAAQDRLLAGFDVDVILGSVHAIDGWAFDDPALVGEYASRDVRALWTRYFDDTIAAARTGRFDVMAHVDLVKKFRFVPDGDLTPLYREAAEAFAAAGVTVEVNTAGLRKPCAELYPAPGFLIELARAGVPATIGSDAHEPSDVGSGWRDAVGALHDAGYTSVSVFRRRERVEVPLR